MIVFRAAKYMNGSRLNFIKVGNQNICYHFASRLSTPYVTGLHHRYKSYFIYLRATLMIFLGYVINFKG